MHRIKAFAKWYETPGKPDSGSFVAFDSMTSTIPIKNYYNLTYCTHAADLEIDEPKHAEKTFKDPSIDNTTKARKDSAPNKTAIIECWVTIQDET